jgi:UDP-glucose 4-epimerase
MKVLITGAAGFIGSNLAAALLERGHSVVGVDNLSHGTLLNLTACDRRPEFSFHELDVASDTRALQAAAVGCDAIVHLAALKIPRYTDALDTLRKNAHGAESVAEVARATGAKLIAASTSDVYGKNPDMPFREDSDLVIGNPEVKRWSYAISKLFEEQLFFAYRDRFDMRVVLLRFFGGYGPHQHLTWWGGPQSVFINAAINGDELEVHGDGSQTRSFTYISDHVRGIIGCIESDAADNRVLNLGNTREISIVGLAEMIWTMVRPGELPRIKFIPYESFGRYEDVMRRVPDVTRARTLLQFEADISLEQGLPRTIEWQIERRRQLRTEPALVR